MSVHSFEDLAVHSGHEVEIVLYGDEDDGSRTQADNAAIECMTCGEVLLDFDRDSFAS